MENEPRLSTQDHADAERFLGLVWHGQDGFYEVAPQNFDARHCRNSVGHVLAGLDDLTYFGPSARRKSGSSKEHVAAGNVLWAEIDLPILKTEFATSAAKEKLWDDLDRRVSELSLPPSAVVDSGNRGYHVYWKLDQLIDASQLERLNRMVSRFLGADKGVNANALLRIPGGINLTTGMPARLVALDATIFDPVEFWNNSVLEPVPVTGTPARSVSRTETSRLVPFPAYPKLSHEVWAYINTRPAQGEGYNRSDFEMRIFVTLAAQGWSDEEIVSFATRMGLPRHTEEMLRGRLQWTLYSIRQARSYLLNTYEIDTSPDGGPTYLLATGVQVPVGASPRGDGDPARYTHLDRGVFLWFIHGQSTAELVREVEQATGHSEITVMRALRQLRDGGHVITRSDPSDRRRRVNYLTDKARHAMTFERFDRGRNSLSLPTLDCLYNGGKTRVGRSPRRSWRVHRPEEVADYVSLT